MQTKSEILRDLNESTRELLAVFAGFPDEHFNSRPSKNAWSAGEVAEHLIKVETGTLRLFSGTTVKTERDPDRKIERIKEEFMNFDKKFTAYGPIVPDDKPKDKERALNKLQDIRQRLASMVELHDLTETCTGFEHGLFGLMTRVEWVYFNIIHTRRHLEQVRNILPRVQ